MTKTTGWLLATSILAAGLPAVAVAQDVQTTPTEQPEATEQPAQVDPGDIVVTGSRILRPNANAAAPITSVTDAEIKAQSPISVEEVLNRLPQIAPDAQQSYQDSDGRQRIKLRNLGFERTLVLVDGLRLGTQNAQDTGIIPVTLLKRVDILSGGASSVYGSDAISGVVNFIMDRDFEGVRLDANYNFYLHDNKRTLASPVAEASGFSPATSGGTDGGRSDLTLTLGKKFFDDRLSLSGFFSYRQAELVPYRARSNSPCYLQQLTPDGPLSCQLSTYSTSGYISPRSGPNNGAGFVNNPAGTRDFVTYGAGPGNAANPFDGLSYQRQLERYNAGGFATLKLSDAVELYSNVLWFRDRSTNPFPSRVLSFTVYGDQPFQVNCNNPFLSQAQASAICGAAAGTGALAPLDVRYRFANSPDVEDTYINQALRITGGVRGSFAAGWSYDVGGVYSRNRQDYQPSILPGFDQVNRSLNVVSVGGVPTCASVVDGTDPACIPFDAFRANSGTADLVNYLFALEGGQSTSIGKLYDVIATINGDLGTYGITSPFAKQGVAIALGLEYREDNFRSFADQAFRDQNGGNDASFRQSAREANVEVQVPLVEDQSWTDLLQLNGGYRYSKYGSNDKGFSTWKAEGVWAPIPDITLRGSINKAQRAPTVIEIAQATNLTYGQVLLQDPCASTRDPNGNLVAPTATLAQCRNTGLADALYGSEALACPEGNCTTRNGGFDIRPETAYTKTFGVILKPRFLPGLTVSVDRYLIDLDDSIGYNDASYYLNGCLATGQPFFCSGVVRDPTTSILFNAAAGNPTAGYFRQGTTNFYKSKAHGWDVQAQYDLSLNQAGRLNFLFNGTRTTYVGGQDAPQYVDANGVTQFLPRNCVGFYGPRCGVSFPKWQHGLRTTYTTADDVFSLSLNWRYIGPQTLTFNSNDPGIGYTEADARSTFNRVEAYNYFDLALTMVIDKRMTLRLLANNLLDTMPPLFPNSYDLALSRNNTNSARYDGLGRQIAIGVTVQY